jgi:UDP:flavonoid glycosyltransferase YjiC (YdhE family)
MKNFKIIPLTTEYTNKIRQTYKDDFGNQVYEEVATGKGPCRISLQPFDVGNDTRLVLKHSPFQINNIFNQPGPIFIQKEEVEPYSDIYNFPPAIKADKENFPLTLIGYNKGQKMIYAKLVGNADVDDLITEIFESKKEIEFLHARNSEACCFICKIERL